MLMPAGGPPLPAHQSVAAAFVPESQSEGFAVRPSPTEEKTFTGACVRMCVCVRVVQHC